MLSHFFGSLHGIGLILIILAGAALLYRFFRFKPSLLNDLDRRDSMEILKIRLASGEITLEEYSKLKGALFS